MDDFIVEGITFLMLMTGLLLGMALVGGGRVLTARERQAIRQ